MDGMLDWLDKQLGRLTGLFALLGAAGVLSLMLIILVAVIWRYGINNPIFGIGDLSVLVLSVEIWASLRAPKITDDAATTDRTSTDRSPIPNIGLLMP